MSTIKSPLRAAVAVVAATALLLGATAQSASAAGVPKGSLPGESGWSSDDQLRTPDSVAEAVDAPTNTAVRVWRRTPQNDLWLQVSQNGTFYNVQQANGSSVDSPTVLIVNNFAWLFHRGMDNRIYYAFMSLATPTAGSNFRLSAWTAVPQVTTSNSPAVTERSGDLWMIYRSEHSDQLRSIHASARGLLNDEPSNWVDNRALNAHTDFGPAVTNLGGTLTLAYLDTNRRLQTQTSVGDNSWSSPQELSLGLPALWGRPAVMASGSNLDYVVLGNDPDGQGGRTIYRISFFTQPGGHTGTTGWLTDPRNFRTASPVSLWATASAVSWIIGISLRGLSANIAWTKTLTSTPR